MNTQILDFDSINPVVYKKQMGVCARVAIATLVIAASAPAGAEEQWTWSVAPYLWATDVGVDVAISDRTVVDETIAFEDLIDDLERVVQVRAEAMRGKHGFSLDLFDVELADSGDRVTLPGGSGAELVMDTEIGMTILGFTGRYNPKGDGGGFSFLYGTRLINLRNDIRAEGQLDGTVLSNAHVDSVETLVDAMVGVHYERQLAKRWTYKISADVSAGDTDLTWSLNPTIGYALGANQRHQLLFGYEQLSVDFADEGSIDMHMTMSGPLFAWRFEF